jgi:hypothetical protein
MNPTETCNPKPEKSVDMRRSSPYARGRYREYMGIGDTAVGKGIF